MSSTYDAESYANHAAPGLGRRHLQDDSPGAILATMEGRLATIETHLEHIQDGVGDLKADMRDAKKDIGDLKAGLGTLAERVGHLPSKGFTVTVLVVVVGLISGIATVIQVLAG